MLKHMIWRRILLLIRLTCMCRYVLQLDIIRSDFKSGLETLLNAKPIRAIFLGVRIGDPTAVFVMLYSKNNIMMTLLSHFTLSRSSFDLQVGQEQFSPSSPGWPPFMRVNPILDWSYRLLINYKLVGFIDFWIKLITAIGWLIISFFNPSKLVLLPFERHEQPLRKPEKYVTTLCLLLFSKLVLLFGRI